MNGRLESLKSREKQYSEIYKKTLLNIQLLKEKGADEQQIKDTTLDSVKLAIELNDLREKIYEIESNELISKKSNTAEEERNRIADLVELARRRKQEIEELFGNEDGLANEESEKQTNTFILYSDKLKIINSYLEIKEKRDLLIHANEELAVKEQELRKQISTYEQENVQIISWLEESVDKVMANMGFSLQDEESIIFEATNQERNQSLNKQILESFANIPEDEIPEVHMKVIKSIKKNRKRENLDYCLAYEKYFVLQAKQIISSIKSKDFSDIYNQLLDVFSLLNERLKLRQKNKIDEIDVAEFFYEDVVKAIHTLGEQIETRTILDNIIFKQQENARNIEFYTNLVNNSSSIFEGSLGTVGST